VIQPWPPSRPTARSFSGCPPATGSGRHSPPAPARTGEVPGTAARTGPRAVGLCLRADRRPRADRRHGPATRLRGTGRDARRPPPARRLLGIPAPARIWPVPRALCNSVVAPTYSTVRCAGRRGSDSRARTRCGRRCRRELYDNAQ
jgi:hypothetical protein